MPTTNKTKALQRSKKYLEDRGWLVGNVEKWIPPRGNMKFGVRVDLWGFGDLLACHPELKVTAIIQCFPLARWKDHAVKLSVIPEVKTWKASGNLVAMHGWALKPKGGVRGAKKAWTLREEQL